VQSLLSTPKWELSGKDRAKNSRVYWRPSLHCPRAYPPGFSSIRTCRWPKLRSSSEIRCAESCLNPRWLRRGETACEQFGHADEGADSRIPKRIERRKLYQKHFKGAFRVLVRMDSSVGRRIKITTLGAFSDLHVTFPEEGMDGFGDFLVVGSEYSDSGGIPYVIAIHLTFIDRDQDDSMQIITSNPRRTLRKKTRRKIREALAK